MSRQLKMTETKPFRSTLGELISETGNLSPIIIFLTPAADPSAVMLQLFQSLTVNIEFHTVSMGQGQGLIAEKAVISAAKKGDWIHLSNLQFAGSWISKVEHLIDETFGRYSCLLCII